MATRSGLARDHEADIASSQTAIPGARPLARAE